MSCCGEKRALLKTRMASARVRRTPAEAPLPAADLAGAGQTSHAALRYLGNGTLLLRGPGTGRVYYFARAGAATVVDESDLDALLGTRLFAQEALSVSAMSADN